MSTAPSSNRRRTVLVSGASGYIGAAVTRAFVHAGWKTYGLVRREEAAKALIEAEAIPIVGTFTDHSFLEPLYKQTSTFDVIASCSEQHPGYASHFEELVALFKVIADKSNSNGVKPLVLWSSGCKDYGQGGVHGSTDLIPLTEESLLNAPSNLKERALLSPTIFNYVASFDAALLRPTSVFGNSSSWYGAIFDYAASEAASGARTLRIAASLDSIMHATHVDDCAEAYVALAQHPDRASVAGQVFNISGHRYETANEVGAALAKEYGFAGGAEFVSAADIGISFADGLKVMFGFSQWIGSDKIRMLTGWSDRRALFSEDLAVYRNAYELAESKGDFVVSAIKDRTLSTFWTKKN